MDKDNILISCLLVNNINFFMDLLIISCNRSFSMDPFTINLYHGWKFLKDMGLWSYIWDILGYLDIYSLDMFSYYELEKDARKGLRHADIKRIAYLRPGMGFTDGLTFFSNDAGCLEMVS